MQLLVEGGDKVTLTQREFLAQGGEASVYVRGDTAYKVYLDPQRALPRGKYQELLPLRDKVPLVVAPDCLLLDPTGNGIRGYTMRYLRDRWILCQVFPRVFRDRHGLRPTWAQTFAITLRQALLEIHKCGVLVVDLNEMNILVAPAPGEIAILDADSFQTKNFPATALMESVRDRHATGFSEGTDWFAFAIVTFQAFCGIHPYKGTHPTVRSLDDRMRANLSVFNKDVRIPAVCYPIDSIPDGWRSWYRAVFESGARTPPPGRFDAPRPQPRPSPTTTTTTVRREKLTMTGIDSFADPIRAVWERDGFRVVLTDRDLYVGGRGVGMDADTVTAVGFVPKTGALVVLTPRGVVYIGQAPVQPLGLTTGAAMDHDGVIYVQVGDKVLSLDLHPTGLTTTRVAIEVLPHATHLFPGVVFQDLIGAAVASFFPKPGVGHQVRLHELDGHVILDARYSRGVLVVIAAAHGGTPARYVYRFHPGTPAEHDVRITPDVGAGCAANLVVLESGVAVLGTETGELEVFHNHVGSRGLQVVDGGPIAHLRLVEIGGKVAVIDGKHLIRVELLP